MGKIIDNIQGVVAIAVKSFSTDFGLDKLDDRAAARLGLILTSGVLEIMIANAARRESKTIDGAEANGQLVVDVQKRMQQQIVDDCGLQPNAAGTLTSAVIMGTGRFQPDLKTLRHEMLGDGPKSAKFK